jgi:cytochrome c
MTMDHAIQSAVAAAHRHNAHGLPGSSIDGSSTRFRSTGAAVLLLALSQFCLSLTAQAQDSGDIAAGEKVFARCKACHQVGEKARNGVGPQLNGVVGRASAAVADYRYSPAMQKADLTWDPATLQAFLQNPKAVVPGTKMTMGGLTKAADFTNLLAYLKQFGPSGTAP